LPFCPLIFLSKSNTTSGYLFGGQVKWIFFIGADGNNFLDFDADIEMFLDGERKNINYPCYFFVPKGMNHCPLVIKRVGKPLLFLDARISEEASVRK
jgi:hypothetical protein